VEVQKKKQKKLRFLFFDALLLPLKTCILARIPFSFGWNSLPEELGKDSGDK
jgi:hypothetical protein